VNHSETHRTQQPAAGAERLNPSVPCETCAFGKAGAACELNNVLKGQIASLGGVPFWCHHAPDGRELNWQGGQAEYFGSLNGKRDIRICAGWKRDVSKNKIRGLFSNPYGVIRRAVAEGALDALQDFLSPTGTAKQKRAARLHINRALRYLTAKDVGPLLIPLFHGRKRKSAPASLHGADPEK
jgi:hypothetical protein